MAGDALRTCLVCGRKQPQASLLRLAVDESATVTVDHDRRLQGRGAYCCNNSLCLRKLHRCRKKIPRALRREIIGWSEELKALSGVNDE